MKRCAIVGVALLSGACSNTSTIPNSGSIIPATQFSVAPGYTLPLEKVVYWAGAAAVAYYVIDPLAPNWEIQEAAFPDNQYRLSLNMKRFYNGGAGEAGRVFKRRADELMRKGGFDSYRIVDYREGIDSSVIGSTRYSEGTIVLSRSDGKLPEAKSTLRSDTTQGAADPARSTVASAENPAS